MATERAVMASPPQPEEAYRLRMSYEEFLAYVDEDVHAEWVEGEVIVFMPPKTRHQLITGFLYQLLKLFADFFQRGRVLSAPFEMKLTPNGPSREPDILLVAEEHRHRLTEERLEGAADLVVEVVSDDSVTRDRVQKFIEYQSAGVREYWLIDSRPGQEQADFYVLDEQGKFRAVPVGEDGIYRSTVLPGFWLRVAGLWAEELPDPLLTFAEIVGPSKVMDALRTMLEG
ncbi:MAG: Uma2 family endonuclease [Abditibacteriales bacterium]|nr:Uma2 family endonuclease [Abditibacteriales bacterium]MDW8366826.1 Uma2 family endonuclease [Abditibacteriales bacterium]